MNLGLKWGVHSAEFHAIFMNQQRFISVQGCPAVIVGTRVEVHETSHHATCQRIVTHRAEIPGYSLLSLRPLTAQEKAELKEQKPINAPTEGG